MNKKSRGLERHCVDDMVGLYRRIGNVPTWGEFEIFGWWMSRYILLGVLLISVYAFLFDDWLFTYFCLGTKELGYVYRMCIKCRVKCSNTLLLPWNLRKKFNLLLLYNQSPFFFYSVNYIMFWRYWSKKNIG